MNSGTHLLVGGTGKTGARIAARLRELGYRARVASRSATGEDVVRFNWDDEATHAPVLEGVAAVYLVAPVGAVDPGDLMISFAKRAMEMGARRFVLLSASSIPEGGPAMGVVHAFIRANAPEWAVLRPTWFMQNFSAGQHLPTIRDEGLIYSATGEGRVPFVDTDDIAEVGVRALTDPQPHNCEHIITGGEPLSYADVASSIERASGRPVRHRNLTEAELAERWSDFGLLPAYADMLAKMDTAIAGGAEDRVSDTVQRVTRRAPKPFRQFARENASLWRLRSHGN